MRTAAFCKPKEATRPAPSGASGRWWEASPASVPCDLRERPGRSWGRRAPTAGRGPRWGSGGRSFRSRPAWDRRVCPAALGSSVTRTGRMPPAHRGCVFDSGAAEDVAPPGPLARHRLDLIETLDSSHVAIPCVVVRRRQERIEIHQIRPHLSGPRPRPRAGGVA